MFHVRLFLRQRFCGLFGGHDRLMHYEKDRLTLRCIACKHDTPGWQLTAPAPVMRHEPELFAVFGSEKIA